MKTTDEAPEHVSVMCLVKCLIVKQSYVVAPHQLAAVHHSKVHKRNASTSSVTYIAFIFGQKELVL